MIKFGDRFRVSADSHSWKLEEKKVQKKDGTNGWGQPKYYGSIKSILDAIIGASARSASETDDSLTVRAFISDLHSRLNNAMMYLPLIIELAAPELQGRWQALGIEGVSSQVAELSDEQLALVEATYHDDLDVLAVVDLIQNCRGLSKLLSGPK